MALSKVIPMLKRILTLAALCALPTVLLAAEPSVGADIPVAPIASAPLGAWSNVFTLRNADLELVIIPAAGRMMKLTFKGGENLFRNDAGLEGKVRSPDAPETWMNYGGDWLWPVAQSRWTSFAGADWPPPMALADLPWTGTAWQDADGTECCLLTRDYGEPLYIKVSRLIKLAKDANRISIRQRIERISPSEIPVVLWNISQIAQADTVVLPADKHSAMDNGVKALMFDLPPAPQLSSCGSANVYHARDGGEHKLGSDSKRGWIAARKSGCLLVERAAAEDVGTHPDGGCTVEMYSNSGLGYTEIETLSVEKSLQPGETLQNTLTLECFPAPATTNACELADAVMTLLGEIQPEPAAKN